jgi:enoyl-CoA hydratase/carnithine racemase
MSDGYTFKGGLPQIKDNYATFKVSLRGDHILHVDLCRPKEFNSTDLAYYDDFVHFFTAVSYERNIRCIVVTSQGKHFCAGLDLSETAPTLMSFDEELDNARKALILDQRIKHMQNAYVAIERCRWPVLVAISGGCIGAGVDMITSCDIAYCTKDSFFSIKEIDIGMVADLGTLQRLPIQASNWSQMKEYALTGEKISADEALRLGLVSRIYPDQETLMAHVWKTADLIASKSPIAIAGVKHTLNNTRNRLIEKGLEDIRRTNMSQLFTNDLTDAVAANMSKQTAKFQKL